MISRSLAWLLLPVLAAAAPSAHQPTKVTALSLSSSAGTARLSIGLNGTAVVRETVLASPDRLIVELRGATIDGLAAYDGVARGSLRDIRARQVDDSTARLVLEFDHMPTYTIDKGNAGVVRVSYPDEEFAPWDALQRQSVRPDVAVAPPAPRTTYASQRTVSRPAAQMGGESCFNNNRAPADFTFSNQPLRDVITQFAKYSGCSFLLGTGIDNRSISAAITNKPWQAALRALLASQQLSMIEVEGGIIRIDNPGELGKLDSIERLDSKMIRLNYAKAGELAKTIENSGLLTKNRGRVSADTGSNTLIISDTRTRIESLQEFIQGLDIRTPMVSIQATLVYVERTDLEQLGIKYDIGSNEQFFNRLTQRFDPLTGQPYNPNVNVVNLGGNAVSAISNADAVITGSALDLVFSTAIGGFSVTSFISALQRVELTDVEASPTITTVDNRPAIILSGSETPVRVIDASSIGQVNQAPRANVAFKETGIQLRATPHVTNNRQILLDLYIERSSVQPLAAADLGYIIPKQSSSTRMLINDGEVAVQGGLTVTTVSRTRSGIPLLSGLPFIGNLFSFTQNSENRQDLIILITPRIIDDPQ